MSSDNIWDSWEGPDDYKPRKKDKKWRQHSRSLKKNWHYKQVPELEQQDDEDI